jgi:hypothetical protein
MPTLNDLTARHGFAVLEHLEAEADIPVLAGLQRQGDVVIIPMAILDGEVYAAPGQASPIPLAGVAVVEAASDGRHEHRLYSHDGTCTWNTAVTDAEGLAAGVLTVPDGGSALLGHAEHGAMMFAPGQYAVRRKREQAAVQQLVAD